ncbi:MAG: ribulose-phosphate 3-epimerase [Candidatus Anstonellales archaeon]
MVEIVPAILSKTQEDFERKAREVAGLVNRVQVDLMDGEFVPNKTLQPEELPPTPPGSEVEYHLMVKDPEGYIKRIGKKHATYIFHYESCGEQSGKLAHKIRAMGSGVGIAISPDTPAERIKDLVDYSVIDTVLVMTVYPGFSGQKYIKAVEAKIRKIRWWNPGIRIEVDGGVNEKTAPGAIRAGANALAVASAIFESQNIRKAIESLSHL